MLTDEEFQAAKARLLS
ncbi:hypothetical protein [Brachybacterium alimentarium]